METPIRPEAASIRHHYDIAQRHTSRARSRAAVNRAFMRGEQWVGWNNATGQLESVPTSAERVRATVNKIGPDSRAIMAKILRRDMPFEVLPAGADDPEMMGARLAEAILFDTHEAQAWEQIRQMHAWATWEGGVGAISVDWDGNVGEVLTSPMDGSTARGGDVILRSLTVHEVYTAPGERNIEQARWWMRVQGFPPETVKATYGLDWDPMSDAQAVNSVYRVGSATDTPTPLTLVFTVYHRPYGGQPGWTCVVVNDRVVFSGDWPFPFEDRLNLAAARVVPLDGTWLGGTPVSDAVPVQVLYNASWSNITEHMKLAGMAKLLVPSGAVEDLDEWDDTPGGYSEYNPINGAKPEYMSAPQMPNWWIEQPALLKIELNDILARHDVSRGAAPGGVQSGYGLSLLQESDDTPMAAMAKELAECWARVATMVLKLYEANVPEQRKALVRLEGNVPLTVEWTGSDLMGQTRASVPLDSVVPRSRAAQGQLALQLAQLGMLGPMPDPTTFARIADLPDQSSLAQQLDPQTALAMRENHELAQGHPRQVELWHDHALHLTVLRRFMCSQFYELLPPQAKELVQLHGMAHEQYAAYQAAQQTQAAALSPIAAAAPTLATKPIDANALQQAAPLAAAVPPEMQQQLPAAGPGPGGPPAPRPGPAGGPPAAPAAPAANQEAPAL